MNNVLFNYVATPCNCMDRPRFVYSSPVHGQMDIGVVFGYRDECFCAHLCPSLRQTSAFVSLRCIVRNELLGHTANSSLTFKETAKLFSKRPAPCYVSTSNMMAFIFFSFLKERNTKEVEIHLDGDVQKCTENSVHWIL